MPQPMRLLPSSSRLSSVVTTAILAVCLFTLGACSTHKPKTTSDGEMLTAIVGRYTEAMKRADAYWAPYFGVEEDLGNFGDYLSSENRERTFKIRTTSLNELKAIDPAKLNHREAILLKLFEDDLKQGIRYHELPLHLVDSFSQMDNRLRSYIDDSSPELSSFPLDSVKHYRDFLKRSEGFPPFVDRQIQYFKDGLAQGYALNCIIAKSAINTYKDALEENIEKNPFYRPALNFPKEFTAQEQQELRTAFHDMVRDRILPAFKKFDAYYRTQYLPSCRKSYGYGSLPRGAELYAYSIRQNTDMDIAAKTLHETGLREVARIEGEIDKVQKQLGYKGSREAFLRAVVADKKYRFASAKEMFDAFLAYKTKIDAEIPKFFSMIPRSEFKIMESENPEDAFGSYRMPTDFQPFGRFVVNTANVKNVPSFGTETLYLHEAIPGHHFQLALQFELKKELTEYQRKLFDSNAFTEGWALYAEKLGRDNGWISSPIMMLGSLDDEMMRAVRLVVDTGIHSMGWSRHKAIKYMKDHMASGDREIQIEADRYSVWPGQALAYKTGQLKILELRDFAQSKLGKQFDIREFHRVVLENGSVSLGALDDIVKNWVNVVAQETAHGNKKSP